MDLFSIIDWHALAVLAITAGVFWLFASERLPMVLASAVGVAAMVLTGCRTNLLVMAACRSRCSFGSR